MLNWPKISFICSKYCTKPNRQRQQLIAAKVSSAKATNDPRQNGANVAHKRVSHIWPATPARVQQPADKQYANQTQFRITFVIQQAVGQRRSAVLTKPESKEIEKLPSP